MAVSVGVFIGLLILAWIAILISGILCAMAAGDLTASSVYDTNHKAQGAHTYLTAGACIGILTFVALTIVVGTAWFSGALNVPDIENLLKYKPEYTDFVKIKKEQIKWKKVHTIQIVLLVSLIVILGLSLTTAIFASIAAGSISSIPNGDAKSNQAYTYSIFAAIIGFLAFGIILASIFIYYTFKSTVDKTNKELGDEMKQIESQPENPSNLLETPSSKK
jgi:flagellar biosynthesis protein FlhB